MFERLRAGWANRSRGWIFLGATTDSVEPAGWPIRCWSPASEPTGERIALRDPLYNENKTAEIYQAKSDGGTIRFARAEFSNGVFGFYIPSKTPGRTS